LGLVYQAAFNGWSGPENAGVAEAGLKSALLGFVIGFGPLLVLWLIGGGGGGDVKLMGALSVWLGFKLTLLVLIFSTVFVLAGSLAIMSWSLVSQGSQTTRRKFIATRKATAGGAAPQMETIEERKKRRIMAYAVPVALATWVVVIWKLPHF
jgi:prepilin peptidase CpaA